MVLYNNMFGMSCMGYITLDLQAGFPMLELNDSRQGRLVIMTEAAAHHCRHCAFRSSIGRGPSFLHFHLYSLPSQHCFPGNALLFLA